MTWQQIVHGIPMKKSVEHGQNLSYCGLVDARISASEKDLPVTVHFWLPTAKYPQSPRSCFRKSSQFTGLKELDLKCIGNIIENWRKQSKFFPFLWIWFLPILCAVIFMRITKTSNKISTNLILVLFVSRSGSCCF